MSSPEWPADPMQAAELLRELAKATPIDEGPLGFVIKPWYWLRHLPRETWSSVHEVVSKLLDDPDPLVARRAIVYFGECVDDDMAERFLALADRTPPGPIAEELQRALSRWAGEGDARRVSAEIRKLAGPRGPATMKPVAVYEPEWVVDVAGRVAEGEDWRWAHAAELIAFFDPPLVLPLMTALRSLATNVKHAALDRVGESLALAGLDQPALAACRAAIGEPDEAPRKRHLWSHTPVALDLMVDVMIEVLGCAKESLSPTPKTGDVTRTWSLESPACTIRIELETHFSPADVNQPEHVSQYARVFGEPIGGAKVTLRGVVGNSDLNIEVDAPGDERDRLLAAIWRRLARPRTAWED